MPDNVVVGLKSLSLKGTVPSKERYVPMLNRTPENIFTEDEIRFLNSLPTPELWRRYCQGENLINLWNSPSVLNVTRGESSKMVSNMKYQMDYIMSIIEKRNPT